MSKDMWRFTAVYSVSALGASLASGSEWLRTFSHFGSWGTISLLLAAGALTWLGVKTAAHCHTRRISSYADLFSELISPSAGPAFSLLLYVLVLFLGGSVAAESAQVLTSGTALPSGWAALLLCALAGWLANRRLEHLAGAAALFLLCAAGYVGALFAEARPIPVPSFSYQLDGPWLWHSALYLGKHFLLALVLLVPLAGEAGSVASLRRAAWLGGGVLLALIGAGHLAILAHWHEVHAAPAPFPVILGSTIPFAGWLCRAMTALQAVLTLALYVHGLSAVTAKRYQLRREPTVLLYALILAGFSLTSLLADAFRAASHAAIALAGIFCAAAAAWKLFWAGAGRR